MSEELRIGANGATARAVKMESAAELLGVGRTTAYGLVASGALRSLKIGSRRLVPLSAIDEFIERQSEQGDDQ